MSLDIKKLAIEAGFSRAEARVEIIELQSFADLILERAAVACEKRAVREHSARGGIGQIVAVQKDIEAEDCAQAIRALKSKPIAS